MYEIMDYGIDMANYKITKSNSKIAGNESKLIINRQPKFAYTMLVPTSLPQQYQQLPCLPMLNNINPTNIIFQRK